MKKLLYPQKKHWADLITRPLQDRSQLEGVVRPILLDVQKNGDAALLKYARLFDEYSGDVLKVSADELAQAEQHLPAELKQAIASAARNIEIFHAQQREEVRQVETQKGVLCWRKSLAIERVGLYIPGGTAPLFSTVLMLAVPARLAGCRQIVLCCPAFRSSLASEELEHLKTHVNFTIHPTMAYCCKMLGIEEVLCLGGAQAIAAMAYGTESVPKVDKIFGPGNQFVTMAKQLVSQEGLAIDMPAGPSEVLVLADESANAKFVAADLLSQAEHGEDSQAMLVTTSERLIDEVLAELDGQIPRLERQQITRSSIEHSCALLFEDLEQCMQFSNAYAPEHLILATDNARALADKVVNAGSVFLGHFTPESAGDYASGTNHTLPTNGYARSYSGVSLDSFVKKITFQEISAEGLQLLGPVIEVMAEAEGLDAHREAVRVRLRDI